MAKASEVIARTPEHRHPVGRQPAPAAPRPGWVYELVVAVLAASSHALRPQDVIHQAQRLHGYRVPPSSIRNCLRQSARHIEGPIERLGDGRYRLRR